MRHQAKATVGTLILLFFAALVCAPARAQQGNSNNPPPPPPQSQGNSTGNSTGSGPEEPGAPPPPAPGMRVWTVHNHGSGWAEWPSRGQGQLGGTLGLGNLDMGQFGLRSGRGLTAAFAMAQRALNDPRIRQQIGISDEQAAKLHQELADFAKTVIQDRANLQVQLVDLRNLLAQQTPDKSAVSDAMQKVGDAQVVLEKAAVDFFVTLKQELSPEQQQKIREFLRQWSRNSRAWGARSDAANPPWPGASSYAGEQPPDGTWYYPQNQQQYAPQWQNSQGQQEQYPPPEPYFPGEPQGSTPTTNNQ
jgi:Spy/CpxP family protein refolding chaperone